MNNRERFSSRVDSYLKYRPSYPKEAIDYLYDVVGLRANSNIADSGSGTGILSKLLLERGIYLIKIIKMVLLSLIMKLRFSGEKYTQAIFGFLGMVASLDLARSSEGTKELLGWKPVQLGLLEDLEQGHYFTSLISTRTSRIHFSSGSAK